MQEARFWSSKLPGSTVVCGLCPHGCVIPEGKTGRCRVRRNKGGRLHALSYGRVVAEHLDPIEKKPLYHFYPGSEILSVGSTGCNLACQFCQNWEISQAEFDAVPAETIAIPDLVARAKECGSLGVAYTYNEPLMNLEWLIDAGRAVRLAGMKNVLVTNGYVNPGPLREYLPLIDAANVDVKAFTDAFYHKLCGARLQPVLRTVEAMAAAGVHVEVTTLLIPGENDAPAEIEALVDWLAGIDDRIPYHLTRYFPAYKMTTPPTPRGVLDRAYEIARKKLKHVHLGNI